MKNICHNQDNLADESGLKNCQFVDLGDSQAEQVSGGINIYRASSLAGRRFSSKRTISYSDPKIIAARADLLEENFRRAQSGNYDSNFILGNPLFQF